MMRGGRNGVGRRLRRREAVEHPIVRGTVTTTFGVDVIKMAAVLDKMATVEKAAKALSLYYAVPEKEKKSNQSKSVIGNDNPSYSPLFPSQFDSPRQTFSNFSKWLTLGERKQQKRV